LKRLARIAGWILLAVLVVAGGALTWAFVTAQSRYNHGWAIHDATFPIPFPLDAAARAALPAGTSDAAADSIALAQAIASGDRLLHTRLPCGDCHDKDLGGGVVIDQPVVGYWAAPNLTTGKGSVTQGFTAHDWDRAVRHGVRRNGKSSSMPSLEFANLSDHELSDVVAYVRSLPPVDRTIKPVRFGAVFAFVVATDPRNIPAFLIDHQAAHAAEPPPAADAVALGKHIAQTCQGCHGPNFSGGKMAGDPNMPIVANLTPDTSGVAGWTEADFLRALQEGKRPDGSALLDAMPWRVYGKMSDVELKALWAYLSTLPPTPKGKR
jgi:cytochrome c553